MPKLESGIWKQHGLVIKDEPLPWADSACVPAEIVAILHPGDGGSYRHYPEKIARKHAKLITAAPAMRDLIATIARFTPPGRDAEDDADTLRSLIAQAQKLIKKAGR